MPEVQLQETGLSPKEEEEAHPRVSVCVSEESKEALMNSLEL